MSNERKAPPRHPSTRIPVGTVEEIAFRVYLANHEPPMTLEQSAVDVYRYKDNKGKECVADDASRRKNSATMLPWTRTFLRVLVDMGMVEAPAEGGAA